MAGTDGNNPAVRIVQTHSIVLFARIEFKCRMHNVQGGAWNAEIMNCIDNILHSQLYAAAKRVNMR